MMLNRFLHILVLTMSFGISKSFHKLDKRFLIFPQAAPTRTQYIVGVGIPVDLERESVTCGAVLKGQFLLPYNATQLYQGFVASGIPLVRKSRKQKKRSHNPRVVAYKILERVLTSYGFDGLDCVLRAICEAATIQFSTDLHFLSELLHIFFTPSSSSSELKYKSTKIYLNAELAGSIGDPCHLHYPRCTLSILDMISTIL